MPTFTALDLNTSSGGTVKGDVTLGFGAGALIGVYLSEHIGIQGEFIYSTDADIIFPPHFMSDVLSLPSQVWIHPPKRRLPKEQFRHFQARVEAQGLEGTLSELCGDVFVASFNEPTPYKLTEKEGRHYTCLMSDYTVWRSAPEMRQRAPAFWDSTRHRGGTLASKSLWHEVGGYSEIYQTWGFEDVDIQWKLEHKCPISG